MNIRKITPSFTKSLILIWLCHLILDFFTGIWPMYKTIAQIDLVTAGLIAGLSGFIGESLQLFFGYFSDRGYRKHFLILGLLLASSVLWVTAANNAPSYFLLLLLLMIGSGAFHPAAAGFAGSISSNRKSRCILFFASGGALGLAISQLAFTQILKSYHGGAFILLLPVAIVLALVIFYPFESPNTLQPSLKKLFQPIFRERKSLSLLYFTQVANFTLMTAFVFLLPDLMRAKGCHTWLCMGGGHLCFILGGALLMVPIGYLCDRYGQKQILLIIITTAFFLLHHFLAKPDFSLLESTFFLTLLGGFMGSINPILVSWGNRLVPESPSTVSALLMGCAWCLGSLGSIWAGVIARAIEIEPIPNTLFWMGFFLLGSFLLVLCTQKPELYKEAVPDYSTES